MSQSVRAVVSLAILAVALLILQLRSTGEAVPLRKPLDSFPVTLGEWRGQGGAVFSPPILARLKLTDYVMRDYADAAGRGLNLYIGYWDNQRTGAGMGYFSPDALYSWRAGDEGAEWIEIHAGEPGVFVDRPEDGRRT